MVAIEPIRRKILPVCCIGTLVGQSWGNGVDSLILYLQSLSLFLRMVIANLLQFGNKRTSTKGILILTILFNTSKCTFLPIQWDRTLTQLGSISRDESKPLNFGMCKNHLHKKPLSIYHSHASSAHQNGLPLFSLVSDPLGQILEDGEAIQFP